MRLVAFALLTTLLACVGDSSVTPVAFQQMRTTSGKFVYWVQTSPTTDAGNKFAIMAIAK
jgi:hypothetical protein